MQNDGVQPIPTLEAAGDTKAQLLWSRAINSDKLSSQERERLADIGLGVDSQKMASDIRSMTDGILNEKKGTHEGQTQGGGSRAARRWDENPALGGQVQANR